MKKHKWRVKSASHRNPEQGHLQRSVLWCCARCGCSVSVFGSRKQSDAQLRPTKNALAANHIPTDCIQAMVERVHDL